MAGRGGRWRGFGTGRLERACVSVEDTTYLLFQLIRNPSNRQLRMPKSMLVGRRCPKQRGEWLRRGIFEETPRPAPRPCWTSSSKLRVLMRAVRFVGREKAGEEVPQAARTRKRGERRHVLLTAMRLISKRRARSWGHPRPCNGF
jgi:hypothetical protein